MVGPRIVTDCPHTRALGAGRRAFALVVLTVDAR